MTTTTPSGKPPNMKHVRRLLGFFLAAACTGVLPGVATMRSGDAGRNGTHVYLPAPGAVAVEITEAVQPGGGDQQSDHAAAAPATSAATAPTEVEAGRSSSVSRHPLRELQTGLRAARAAERTRNKAAARAPKTPDFGSTPIERCDLLPGLRDRLREVLGAAHSFASSESLLSRGCRFFVPGAVADSAAEWEQFLRESLRKNYVPTELPVTEEELAVPRDYTRHAHPEDGMAPLPLYVRLGPKLTRVDDSDEEMESHVLQKVEAFPLVDQSLDGTRDVKDLVHEQVTKARARSRGEHDGSFVEHYYASEELPLVVQQPRGAGAAEAEAGATGRAQERTRNVHDAHVDQTRPRSTLTTSTDTLATSSTTITSVNSSEAELLLRSAIANPHWSAPASALRQPDPHQAADGQEAFLRSGSSAVPSLDFAHVQQVEDSGVEAASGSVMIMAQQQNPLRAAGSREQLQQDDSAAPLDEAPQQPYAGDTGSAPETARSTVDPAAALPAARVTAAQAHGEAVVAETRLAVRPQDYPQQQRLCPFLVDRAAHHGDLALRRWAPNLYQGYAVPACQHVYKHYFLSDAYTRLKQTWISSSAAARRGTDPGLLPPGGAGPRGRSTSLTRRHGSSPERTEPEAAPTWTLGAAPAILANDERRPAEDLRATRWLSAPSSSEEAAEMVPSPSAGAAESSNAEVMNTVSEEQMLRLEECLAQEMRDADAQASLEPEGSSGRPRQEQVVQQGGEQVGGKASPLHQAASRYVSSSADDNASVDAVCGNPDSVQALGGGPADERVLAQKRLANQLPSFWREWAWCVGFKAFCSCAPALRSPTIARVAQRVFDLPPPGVILPSGVKRRQVRFTYFPRPEQDEQRARADASRRDDGSRGTRSHYAGAPGRGRGRSPQGAASWPANGARQVGVKVTGEWVFPENMFAHLQPEAEQLQGTTRGRTDSPHGRLDRREQSRAGADAESDPFLFPRLQTAADFENDPFLFPKRTRGATRSLISTRVGAQRQRADSAASTAAQPSTSRSRNHAGNKSRTRSSSLKTAARSSRPRSGPTRRALRGLVRNYRDRLLQPSTGRPDVVTGTAAAHAQEPARDVRGRGTQQTPDAAQPPATSFDATSCSAVEFSSAVRRYLNEDPKRSVVMYVHGGAFVAASPASVRMFTYHWAAASKALIFAVDYRKPPFATSLEGSRADVYQGAWKAYLREQLQIPANRIVVWGDSAGGALLVWMLGEIAREAKRDAARAAETAANFSFWEGDSLDLRRQQSEPAGAAASAGTARHSFQQEPNFYTSSFGQQNPWLPSRSQSDTILCDLDVSRTSASSIAGEGLAPSDCSGTQPISGGFLPLRLSGSAFNSDGSSSSSAALNLPHAALPIGVTQHPPPVFTGGTCGAAGPAPKIPVALEATPTTAASASSSSSSGHHHLPPGAPQTTSAPTPRTVHVLRARQRQQRENFPRGVVLISPWLDLDMDAASQLFSEEEQVNFHTAVEEGLDVFAPSMIAEAKRCAMSNHEHGRSSSTAATTSPIMEAEDIASNLLGVPWLFQFGAKELLLDWGIDFWRMLRRSSGAAGEEGAHLYRLEVYEATHAHMPFMLGLEHPLSKVALYRAMDWVRRL